MPTPAIQKQWKELNRWLYHLHKLAKAGSPDWRYYHEASYKGRQAAKQLLRDYKSYPKARGFLTELIRELKQLWGISGHSGIGDITRREIALQTGNWMREMTEYMNKDQYGKSADVAIVSRAKALGVERSKASPRQIEQKISAASSFLTELVKRGKRSNEASQDVYTKADFVKLSRLMKVAIAASQRFPKEGHIPDQSRQLEFAHKYFARLFSDMSKPGTSHYHRAGNMSEALYRMHKKYLYPAWKYAVTLS